MQYKYTVLKKALNINCRTLSEQDVYVYFMMMSSEVLKQTEVILGTSSKLSEERQGLFDSCVF